MFGSSGKWFYSMPGHLILILFHVTYLDTSKFYFQLNQAVRAIKSNA